MTINSVEFRAKKILLEDEMDIVAANCSILQLSHFEKFPTP